MDDNNRLASDQSHHHYKANHADHAADGCCGDGSATCDCHDGATSDTVSPSTEAAMTHLTVTAAPPRVVAGPKHRCLLIYPLFPDTFWSYKHALRIIRRKAALPPLGLLTVAAMLPKHWEIRLVDLNVRPLRDSDLQWADSAWLSGMTVQGPSAEDVVARCRAAGVRTVAGGPLFTMEPQRFSTVDHLVLGEAERSLPPFLRDFTRYLDRRQRGELAQAPAHRYDADGLPEMDEAPLPRYDLVKPSHYASLSLQYSRGCPFDCEFCNVTSLFGRRPRVKSPEKIKAELDAIVATGFRGSVFFVDDNFIGNKPHVKKQLLPSLIDWQRQRGPMRFYTEASINLADDESLMNQMGDAGFDMVFIGIETPDEDTLTACGKKQNTKRDLVTNIKKINAHGIEVQAGFIVGFDGDEPTVFRRQIDFIQQSGITTAMVGMLQAPIGTRLFSRLAKEGRIIDQKNYSGDNANGGTNVVPTMGLDTLRAGYKQLLDEIYHPKPYYERARTFLQSYSPPRVKMRIEMRHLTAFARACWHLGVVGRERFEYWKLIAWTLAKKPAALSEAITIAVRGRHYRKMAQLHVQ